MVPSTVITTTLFSYDDHSRDLVDICDKVVDLFFCILIVQDANFCQFNGWDGAIDFVESRFNAP